MYESPIRIFESTIDSFSKAIIKQRDDAIFAEIQYSFGVDLDRGELVRALQYDRNQYDKGYADGKRDAEAALVRCKDCKHNVANKEHDPLDITDYTDIVCDYWMNDGNLPDDFCSYGERKDNG